VADVHGHPLGAVRGGGIGQVGVLGEVVGRQGDRGAVGVPADVGRPVGVNGGDGPHVTVDHPAAKRSAQPPVVAAGDDVIPDRGDVVAQLDGRAVRDGAGFDQRMAGPFAQHCGLFVGGHDHQGGPTPAAVPDACVGPPRLEQTGLDLVGGTGMDPPAHRVLRQGGGVAAAKRQAGVGLPGVDEPADLS